MGGWRFIESEYAGYYLCSLSVNVGVECMVKLQTGLFAKAISFECAYSLA